MIQREEKVTDAASRAVDQALSITNKKALQAQLEASGAGRLQSFAHYQFISTACEDGFKAISTTILQKIDEFDSINTEAYASFYSTQLQYSIPKLVETFRVHTGLNGTPRASADGANEVQVELEQKLATAHKHAVDEFDLAVSLPEKVGYDRARSSQSILQTSTDAYVHGDRIVALQDIGRNDDWDFARLVELCRELNVAANNQCHMSTAMILRTILNHVPPVLGFVSFAEIANNYGAQNSERSFKKSMQRLENSLRNIADTHLHTPIRSREDVPTAVQVNFAPELDVLLGEIIRVCKSNSD